MAKRDIKRLKDIEAAKIDVIDGASASFLKSLDRVLSRLNTRVQEWALDLEGDKRIATSQRNLARAANAAAELEEMLSESGYRESVDRLVRSYDRIAEMSRAGFRAAGIDDVLSQTDVRALVALRDLDLRRWEALGDDLVRAIHGQLLDATVGGASFRELSAGIEKALRGDQERGHMLEARAKTLANTLSQSFDRAITNRKAASAGVGTFIYLGPDDEVTRPFCQAVLAGTGAEEFNVPAVDGDPPIYTDDQIAAMDNGQGLPVFQYAGGYNCRHRFRPISVKVAEEVLA